MPVQTKIFRVFVSSTFSDMREERGVLQKDVFPRLEKYCEQNGAQFQAIDLRWGVNEESQLYQKTMDICLNEIKRCQKMSPKPNFIMLLGDRYGWQPLPARIDAEEFVKMVDLTPCPSPTGEGSRRLLEKWYLLDDNALPSEYVLQPRSEELREYAAWEPIERKLRETLRSAAVRAGLTEDQKVKYFASATHQEIMLGALNPPHDVAAAREHVFAYLRNVEGLPDNETAGQYVNLVDGKVNSFAQSQLAKLRTELKTKLGDEHCVKYDATWKNGTVALPDAAAFGEMVYNHLFGVIEAQIKEFVSPGEVEHERLLQKEFREKLVEHFKGRDHVLNLIAGYLTSPPAPLPQGEGRKIFALVGESGSGKSSVMAKAITDAKQRKGFHIYRFLGTTSRTSDVMGLLQSLCAEITGYYGTTAEELFCKGVKDEDKSERLKALYTEKGLRELFHTSLTLATPEKPMMLFLDALDQLSGADEDFSLYWLPREIPANVSFVVSCLPTLRNQLSAATVKNLDLLPVSEAGAILDAWLNARDCKRTLQPQQRATILTAFDHTKLPIYLRLAFEAAKKWHSYDTAPSLPNDVPGILGSFFAELEVTHTRTTVSKAIGYMLSGRYGGLTEKEILDMLVFDNEHWGAFLDRTHEDHRQEVQDRKVLPVVVWSRLFLDLEPYLTERNMHGARIVTFFHRQFLEYAVERYCAKVDEEAKGQKIGAQTDTVGVAYNTKLADYFAAQEMFLDGDTRERPNARKCVELPWQQVRAEKKADFESTLLDYEFILAKVEANLLDDLLEDYRRYEDIGEDVRLVGGALDLSAYVLRVDKRQLPSQMRGRLLDREELGIIDLCKIAEKFTRGIWLNPVSACLTRPGGALVRTLTGHTDSVWAVSVTSDGKLAISGSLDETIRVWDIVSGKLHRTLRGHTETVLAVSVTPDGKTVISGSGDNTLKVWNIASGKELKTLTGHSDLVSGIIVTPNGKQVISASFDNTLKVWDIATGEELRSFRVHEGWSVNAVCITPDGKLAISGSADSTLKVWDIMSGKEIRTLTGHTDKVLAVSVTPNGNLAISASRDHTLKVWDIVTGDELRTLDGHEGWVNAVCVTPNGKLAISASEDDTIKIWDIELGKELRSYETKCNVKAISVTPNGKLAITAGANITDLMIWNITSDKHNGMHTAHSRGLESICMSPDGKHAISLGKYEKSFKLWETGCGKELRMFTGHEKFINAVCFTPDGKIVISASGDNTLNVWDVKDCKVLRTLKGHTDRVSSVTVTPDGMLAISGAYDKTLKGWDISSGQELRTFTGHTKSVNAIYVTPDGKSAISISGGTLKSWDIASGKELSTLICEDASSSVTPVKVIPNRKLAISGRWDNVLMVWDIVNGKKLRTLSGHTSDVADICVTPDGMFAISASTDTTLKLWNIDNGLEILTLAGHTSSVRAVNVTPDGKLAISAAHDKTLKVWDITRGKEVASFTGEDKFENCVVAPVGGCIAAGTQGGLINFLQLMNVVSELPISLFPNDDTSNNTSAFSLLRIIVTGFKSKFKSKNLHLQNIAEPVSEPATIFIASIPPLADVYIKDKFIGKTNVNKLNVMSGTHTLRFKKEGTLFEQEFTFKPGNNQAVFIRLK